MTEASGVGVVRREALELARDLGLGETDRGRVGLVVNELAGNLVKHAQDGEVIVGAIDVPGCQGVELIAHDAGPGIPDVARALEDGYSTAGSPGTGLGAIRRAASAFDLYTAAGAGTTIVARVCGVAAAPRAPFAVGAVSLPYPGELVCGDGWAVAADAERITAMVVDGLGHGAGAAEAAREAERVFGLHTEETAPAILERIHGAIRHTRGAAVAVAQIRLRAGVLKFAGIGNISAALLEPGAGGRSLVSQSGIVGSDVRRIQEFSYPFSPEMLLVLHSDGLSTHWQLEPALAAHDPSVIAGTLYRVARRGRDDATVVVLRATEGRP